MEIMQLPKKERKSKGNEVMKELIQKAAVYLEEYQKRRDESGLDYNIFTLMHMERDEAGTHETMIFTILNYRTNAKVSQELKKQFLISMGLPKSFWNETWIVEREYYTESNGRMDLFFRTAGRNKKCVVVELKVDAKDQEQQIKRYEEYVLAKKYEDYRIIYLTLNGRNPSRQSYEGIVHPKKLLRRSFGVHVADWLTTCMDICREYAVEASFIQQYRILIMKLAEEESVEKNMAGLIKSSKDLKACIGLAEALPAVKGRILFDFMDAIYKNLQKMKGKALYADYDCAKDYYGGSAYCPDFAYKITDFTARNRKITLALGVEVDYKLFFYFGYFNEQHEIISSEQFKKGNKKMNQWVEKAITETLNCDIRSNGYTSIFYQYIVDGANQIYDFKHFSENCAELKDVQTLDREAEGIAANLMNYIREIHTRLKNVSDERKKAVRK